MGSMSIPASGRIYLDASAVIYSIERHPMFAPLLEPAWAAMVNGGCELITSELTILESMVAPIRARNQSLLAAFERAFDESGLQLLPANRSVMLLAAELRASFPSLRAPDAIHLATAEIYSAQSVITNDQKLKGKGSVSVTLLSESVASQS
jgi:predicted nucleic acid-binding protein